MKLKPIATGLTALFAFAAGSAQAQISNDTIKIGVITDMSGLYADIDGPGGVEAVKMAIADFGPGTLFVTRTPNVHQYFSISKKF